MACQLQIRDLLGCCSPAVLSAAARPLESDTWVACLAVVHGFGDDLQRVAGAGAGAFTDAVRVQLPRLGRTRLCGRIVRAVFSAMTDTEGLRAQRDGTLERVGLIVEDWLSVRAGLGEIESRMIDVLDELELTTVVTSCAALVKVELGWSQNLNVESSAGAANLTPRWGQRPPHCQPWASPGYGLERAGLFGVVMLGRP